MEQGSSPRATAVRVLGVFFAALFLGQVLALSGAYGWYRKLFGYMPVWMIDLRFGFSFLLRAAGAAGAIGLIMLKEWGRRLSVGVALFSALTSYWKHPYAAVLRFTRDLDKQFGPWLGDDAAFSSAAPAVWAAIFLPALALSVAAAYFLTRPKTKAVFL